MNEAIFTATKVLLAYTYPGDDKEPEKEYQVGGFAADKIMERCSRTSLTRIRTEFERMRQAFRTVFNETSGMPATTIEAVEQDGGPKVDEAIEHTLTFTKEPSHNEWLAAARAACGGALRCTYVSKDKLTYRVRAVDVQAQLRRQTTTPSNLTWTVPVTITCNNCKREWQGWKVLARQHFDNRPYYWSTMYCPDCPPVDDEVWLIDSLGIMVEKPEDFVAAPRPRRTPAARTTIELPDFSDLELED